MLILAKDFGSQTKVIYGPDGQEHITATPGVWVLGNSFLHNYYSIFDLENQRVGLVPSSSSDVGVVGLGVVPWTFQDFANLLAWFVIIFWSAVLIKKVCGKN